MGTKEAFACLLAALACACGGQTEEQNGPARCREAGREATTIAAADTDGYPASRIIDPFLAGRSGRGQAVWVTGPPELWTAHGATAPADRSGPGRLTAELTNLERVFVVGCWDSRTGVARRDDHLLASLRATLTLDETGVSLGASGELGLYKGLPESEVRMTTDGQVEGQCTLYSENKDDLAFAYGEMRAVARCLDPWERTNIDDLFPDATGLLADVNRESPITLNCGDGSTASLTYELRAPDRFCPLDHYNLVAPATASLESVALGMTTATEVPTTLQKSYLVNVPNSDDLMVKMPVKSRDGSLVFHLKRTDEGRASIAATLSHYSPKGEYIEDCQSTPLP